jgi:hypothetical protein
MYFYTNFYENLTLFNSYSVSFGGFGSSGALIRIDNSSYLTSYLPEDGIKISPGAYTSISLSRSFKNNLPRPYSNCLINNQTNAGFQSELFNIIQSSPYRYTQPTCFGQCFQRATYQECNCTNPSFIFLLPNLPLCLSRNQTNCLMSLLSPEKLLKNDFFQKNCLDDCPLECYLDQFDTSLSSAELIPNILFDFIMSNSNLKSNFIDYNKIDMDAAKKSFVYFSVFYKQLSYEVSSESPQLTLITLFANMGSYLGLFLGVSVFSLVEIIQVLIEIAFVKSRKSSD